MIPYTKQQITNNRKKWLKFLRTTNSPQIYGSSVIEKPNRPIQYCALGTLRAVFGTRYPAAEAEQILGLDKTERNMIVDWNDDEKLTFKQIADKFAKYSKNKNH